VQHRPQQRSLTGQLQLKHPSNGIRPAPYLCDPVQGVVASRRFRDIHSDAGTQHGNDQSFCEANKGLSFRATIILITRFRITSLTHHDSIVHDVSKPVSGRRRPVERQQPASQLIARSTTAQLVVAATQRPVRAKAAEQSGELRESCLIRCVKLHERQALVTCHSIAFDFSLLHLALPPLHTCFPFISSTTKLHHGRHRPIAGC
jgi:hypothetical protein